VMVNRGVETGALLAVTIAVGRLSATQVGPDLDPSDQPLGETSTTDLGGRIERVAEATELQLAVVIGGAIAEADAAALCQEKRRESVRINDSRRLALPIR
jgi:hypothetical protein